MGAEAIPNRKPRSERHGWETSFKQALLLRAGLAIARIKDNTPSDKAQTKKAVITKLFGDLATRFAERNGGYTRIIRTGKRVGDAADACILQFVEAGAPASRKKAAAPVEAKPEAPAAEAKAEVPAEEVKA